MIKIPKLLSGFGSVTSRAKHALLSVPGGGAMGGSSPSAPTPQLEANSGWVRDRDGKIHFYQYIYDEDTDSANVTYFSEPAGVITTPTAPVLPYSIGDFPGVAHALKTGQNSSIDPGYKKVEINVLTGRVEINGYMLGVTNSYKNTLILEATASERVNAYLDAITINPVTANATWQWIALSNVEI